MTGMQKAGFQTTCGQQSKVIRLSSKPKHSLAAKTQSDLHFFQIAQPQVCYLNPKQETLDLKSSMCRKVSQAAKTSLSSTSLERICLKSIGPLSALAPPDLSHSRVPKEARPPNSPQNHPPL